MFRTAHIITAAVLGVLLITTGCSHESAPKGDDQAEGQSPTTAEPISAANATVYGDGVKQSDTVAITALLENPEAYAGKSVRVEGTVTDVCPKRGCWFDMAGEKPGQKLRFKVQDGVMVFPMDAKGKSAAAEGVVTLQTLSLEETRRYLEYQASEYGADVDPDNVTEPMTIVRLDGTGALVKD